MASGLARRLVEHGVAVLTDVSGRSEASRARARASGMTPVSREDLIRADVVMSVLPPSFALAFATELAPIVKLSPQKPLFVDCNAVNPATLQSIAKVMEPTGAAFVDVGIIGLPPKDGAPQPRLYAAGAPAERLIPLKEYGLDIRVIEGPLGAASALKMCYGGITKGTLFVAAAMLLAASRAGVGSVLGTEMSESEPHLLMSLSRRIPDMLPKAYRWVAEMEQISEFTAADPAAGSLYSAAARFYERMAADLESGGVETSAFAEFFRNPSLLSEILTKYPA